MPPRTRRAAAKPAVPTVEADEEEPVATPRRRRTATSRVKPTEQPVEVEEDEEPVAKPRRRRLATVEAPADDEPAAKPVRRAKATTTATKRAAAKPVAEEEPDDGMTPNQRKMAKLRAMRKPKDPSAAPAAAKPKRAPIEFGTNWLAEVVSEAVGREITSFDLRAVLRRLAGQGVLKRDVGVERGRYEFTGPKDPAVKAVVNAYKSGEVDADKREKLAALKAKKLAAKPAAKPARGRAKPVSETVDDDEEYDDDDVDELDEE